jgi:uncharacterized protein YraI
MDRNLMSTGTEAIAAGLGRTMDRRSAVRLMLGVGAVAVAGGASLALSDRADARSTDGYLQTTSALNLRERPSTRAKILLVLPKGVVLTNYGEEQNGFLKVGYQGKVGWAHGSYIQGATPNFIGDAVTTTAVNFRQGPSTSHTVIQVLSKGSVVHISDLVSGGFRLVVFGDIGGWVSDDYLAPSGGEGEGPAYFTTTTAVNLRAKPSTSAKILKVVPAGATVADYDLVMSNGFRGVDYNGTRGWIYDAYLR